MALRTYDITLPDGNTYSLRLTSQATRDFIKIHGQKGAAPWISVCAAVDDLDKQIDLFQAALHYPGAPQQPSGMKFIDLLADGGHGEFFRRELVIRLAHASGLLDDDSVENLAEAVRTNSQTAMKVMVNLLTGKSIALDEDAANEAEDADEENPT